MTQSCVALALLAGHAHAQDDASSRTRPVHGPVRDGGVYHAASETWTRRASAAGIGADVVYDNTVPSGYFGALSGDRFVDEGRVPSPTSPTNIGSRPGCATVYTVDGFQIGYCTDQVGFSASTTTIGFYQSLAACSTVVGVTPTATFGLTGLPGSSGASQCWTVTIDLDGPPSATFSLLADGDGAYAAPEETNLFGWSFESSLPDAAQSGTGPLIAGDPNLAQRFDGTRWDSPVNYAEAGTGMGTRDVFRIEDGPTPPGCYFYNGNPFASYHLELHADACNHATAVSPHCSDFNEMSMLGWNANGTAVGLSLATTGPSGLPTDAYLRAADQSGASAIFAPAGFKGSYQSIAAGGCGSLSFDVQVFVDGDGSQHLVLNDFVTLVSGNLRATFSTTQVVTEPGGAGPGWHHVTAPLWSISNGQLPSSQDGAWTMTSGTPAQWNTLLANVTDVILRVDFGGNPAEILGYDNICIRAEGGCRSGINKDIVNDTGVTAHGVEITIQGQHPLASSVFNGPFSSPTITVGANTTVLRWFGGSPGTVAPNVIGHVGFVVPAPEITVLRVAWLGSAGTEIGCVCQVSAPDGTPLTPGTHLVDGVVRFRNTVNHCAGGSKGVHFDSIEWGAVEEPLDQLVSAGVRNPLRVDAVGATFQVAPGAEVVTNLSLLPPLGADWAVLVFDVDCDGLPPYPVRDWVQVRVVRPLDLPAGGGAVVGTPFCFGDGTGTACPCANNGVSGNGCANSLFTAGANLAGAGTASIAADTVVLTTTSTPNSSVLFFQGTIQQSAGAGAAFGDGKRCAGGSVVRLGTKNAVGNTASYPQGGDPSVSVRGLVTLPGSTRTYQGWYRNAAAFCTASTFNLTNGLEVAWGA